jgi:hypothetical protein
MYSNPDADVSGWRAFSAVMLFIAGVWNIIDGIIGIANASYYQSVAAGHNINLPITNSLTTWGWVALAMGAVMLIVAAGVFMNAMWAQVVGVIAVGINMVFQMAFLASFPLWSLMIIALDALIIYGIVVPTTQTGTGTGRAA